MFSDGAPRSFGTGWISGVLAVALGLLCLASILCLHFPHWLTIPDLRGRYPLALVRTAIDLAILAVLILSALSMVLRRRKMLGLAGLGLAALCLLLGAGGVEIPRAQGAGIYVGLDWFVLGVLATATLFVPLERAWALRPGQGPFRRGWLTDFQYFFMSHALVQLMSVLVLAPPSPSGMRLRFLHSRRLCSGCRGWSSSSPACSWPIWRNMPSIAPFTAFPCCGVSTGFTTRSRLWTGLPDRGCICSMSSSPAGSCCFP